jgi:1,4-alpha-glucan branching enzyme
VPVVPGRRYQYQFVVDGRWVTDPLAPAADDGFGGRNAVLDL